ncbi:MAG: hypothetical protein GY847_00465 [Proteobacteria bacterium]|nr:hypothetical protein [Pseudomonadota bacterium]
MKNLIIPDEHWDNFLSLIMELCEEPWKDPRKYDFKRTRTIEWLLRAVCTQMLDELESDESKYCAAGYRVLDVMSSPDSTRISQ